MRTLFAILTFLVCPVLHAAEPPAKGLVVHEWGVFRVHDDADTANADMRAIWDGLPKFVYGQIKDRNLPIHWPNVEVRDRPVVFFHAASPMTVRMKVDFPGGFPAVWWPGTVSPATVAGSAVGVDGGKPATSLEWRLRLKQPPAGYPKPASPDPGKDHWMTTCRAVAADDVYAYLSDRGFQCERESFVYYDGVFPRGEWLAVSVDKDRVGLRSRVRHLVYDVTVVDCRTAGKVRVARIGKLEAGVEVKSVEFAEADAGRFADEAEGVLVKQLTGAGLNDAEARSLATLWKGELFAAAGVTVFYRIPQAEYDRLLPLTIVPKPEKTVRVGLVHHADCGSDLAERVMTLIKEMDAEDFAQREAATAKLAEMGRAAYVHLLRLRKQNLPAEIRSRVELLLEKHDSRKAFKS